MSSTYLTTDELARRIKYDVSTIRERLKDSVLLEGSTTSGPSAEGRSSSCGKHRT